MVSAVKRLNLGATFAGAVEVAARFPLPAFCALLFAGLFIGDQHDFFDARDERLLSFLALGFFAALAGTAAIVFLGQGRYDDVWAVHFLFLLPGLLLLTMAAPFLARTGANDAFFGVSTTMHGSARPWVWQVR